MRAHLTPWTWMPLLLTLGACKAYDASLLTTQWNSTADTVEACAAGARDVAVELCNGEDDDCDGVLDEDAVNCDRQNRPGRCVFGACVSDSCDPGFGDCNKLPDDGCERALGECTSCDAACLARLPGHEVAHASNLGTPDATVPDTPTAANSGPPPLVDADLDAGENPPGQIPETDAGSKPQTPVDECADTSVCSGSPQECATKRSRCECVRNAPTGQGPECDSCTCELCPRELRDCIESGDAAWDNTCGALTKCFGQGRANNRCVPANCSDVCPNEYVASSDRRFGLFGDPQCEFGSCSAFQALRQQCYAAKCRGVCKF